MKTNETKREFVRLRGEGKSLRFIATQLHISKSTCQSWERALSAELDDLKRAELAELAEAYGMAKAARIRRLGEALKKIDSALEEIDFTTIDPSKLLELKLKYMEALKNEYTGGGAMTLENVNAKTILAAFADLLNRMRAGEVAAGQAREEGGLLAQLLKAYETVEIKTRLDELETIIEGGGNEGKRKLG